MHKPDPLGVVAFVGSESLQYVPLYSVCTRENRIESEFEVVYWKSASENVSRLGVMVDNAKTY